MRTCCCCGWWSSDEGPERCRGNGDRRAVDLTSVDDDEIVRRGRWVNWVRDNGRWEILRANIVLLVSTGASLIEGWMWGRALNRIIRGELVSSTKG